MHLVPLRLEAELTDAGGGAAVSVDLEGTGTAFGLGPLEVELELHDAGLEWSVAVRGDRPVRIRSVSFVYAAVGGRGPVRMLRNGYQSWTPTGVGVVGFDVDPSLRADLPLLQAAHHADQRRARPDELRSEWVTVLADDPGPGSTCVLVGFMGGGAHDGTVRASVPDGTVEVRVEAFLGDAVLDPGASRPLHPVLVVPADTTDALHLLERWAERVGRLAGARTGAPYRTGWCSWYQYFHDVTESDIAANLAAAEHWPFDVFQIDDGWQAAVGDWLTTNERFPSDPAGLAGEIRDSGRTPGLWIAPFLVAPDSEVARTHPEWMARHVVDGVDAGPLFTWWNPLWGGGRDGFMYGLDTTRPDVLAHLESVASSLVGAGFPYLKLDFTFSPSADGGYADAGRTPAERVRAGFAAIRRGVGEDAFLLACGAPLANVVGLVDAARIGPDVAPTWSIDPAAELVPGYLAAQPATAHAATNVLTRAFMHRRLWCNDPDCLMLRPVDTDLSPAAVRTWAHTVAVSGGMATVSDDLGLLGTDARTLLDEVVALGHLADDAAMAGDGARCPDLLDHADPRHLVSAAGALELDPVSGTSVLVPSDRT